MEILEKLSLAGLVPVIKVEDAADAVPLCKALSDGGLPVAEITFRTAAAEEAIRRVKAELPNVILGAGTVLSVEQVQKAIAAGAAYIVSPGLNPKVVGYCVDNNIPVLPGCCNPSDIETAMSFGLNTVKFFPAEPAGGIKFIKAISAPYGSMKFVPTGGINEANLLDYITFPKIAACGGSWMVPSDAIKAKDWNRITELTRKAVKLLLGLELRHIGLNFDASEEAANQAKLLSTLTGLPVIEGNSSIFVGTEYEFMKSRGLGKNGHIALGVNNIARAKWHIEQLGFTFREAVPNKEGIIKAIYLNEEIGGFAIHIVQR